jgi:hypothetical protein
VQLQQLKKILSAALADEKNHLRIMTSDKNTKKEK